MPSRGAPSQALVLLCLAWPPAWHPSAPLAEAALPRHACACSRVCTPSTANATERCFDPIPRCASAVQFLRTPEYRLAALEWNTVYRASDITRTYGSRWRLDSMSVLCEPRYRGTLLREALRRSSTIDGRPLANVSDDALEALIASRTEGGASEPGHALRMGWKGPNGVHLGRGVGHFALALLNRWRARQCAGAPADTLVVMLRLGDGVGNNNATEVEARIDGMLAELAANGTRLARAVVSGVLNYATNPMIKLGSRAKVHHPYERQAAYDERSVQLVDRIVAHARARGLETTVRSVADADLDICYYVFSPHVALSGELRPRGFGSFVRMLRERVAAIERGEPNALVGGQYWRRRRARA